MRKWIILGCFIISVHSLSGQALNVNLLGRWSQGRCEAIHHRNGYTFVGNGPTLEVYQMKPGIYEKLTDIRLPGLIKDIWAKEGSDTTLIVYVACYGAGLRILLYDWPDNDIQQIGGIDTHGLACGIMQYGNRAYVANGPQGLQIYDVGYPDNPQLLGSFATAGFAQDVWAVNDSTVLVAADTAGLYSIRTKYPAAPVKKFQLRFDSAFSGFSIPLPKAVQIVVSDSIAYIAAGWGGMRTVNISNPDYLRQRGVWTYGVPVEVLGLWVSGNYAYLGCGKDGLFSPINITNPANPTGPPFQNLDTDGYTSSIVVDQDVAYVADGYNGHLTVDVKEGFQPAIINSFKMGDICYDAAFSNQYAYVCAGKTGVRTFNSAISNPPLERIPQAGSFDTPGEARGIKKAGPILYVADGSYGLTILNAANPIQLAKVGEFATQGDTTYQVDVVGDESGTYVFMAGGKDGLRVVNFSGGTDELEGSPIDTRGRARDVHVVNQKIYLADSSGVYVYNYNISVQQQSIAVTPADSLPSNGVSLDARALAVSGDTVYVANGKYGILLWRMSTDAVLTKSIGGVCTDIAVHDNTLYVSESQTGFRIYDASTPGALNEVGYYRNTGSALGVGVSDSDSTVVLADGPYGFTMLRSFIHPVMEVSTNKLNFGPVPADYSRPLTVYISNTGTSILRISNIITSHTAFKFSETQFTVPAGSTHRIVVRFEPKNNTVPYPNLVERAAIYSNDPADTLFQLTLQGQISALVTEGSYNPPDVFTVGLWHFDEEDGVNSVADRSGNNLNGELVGNPARQNSDRGMGYGRQILFNNSGGWVRIPANALLNLYNKTFTVELWFSMTSKPQTSCVLMKRGDEGTQQQFVLALGSGNAGLIGRVWDSSNNLHSLTTGSMDALNTNQWYHAAMTYDGDSLKLYLNGVLRAKKALSGDLRYQAIEPLAIGANSFGTSGFNGVIDEVRISDIARESWEYHVTRSRLEASPQVIQFGNVLANHSRTIPLVVSNVGSQPLIISGVTTNNTHVTVAPSSQFTLFMGHTDTLWVKFEPVDEELLGQSSSLAIQSSDPTYPNFTIPLRGAGVTTLPAGPYKTDPFCLGIWHLDETSGTVVRDSSGNALNGTLFGNVFHELEIKKFVPGASLRFDRSNGVCTVKPPSDLRISPAWGGMSVETWFYLQGLPLGKGTLLKRGETANPFHLYIDSTATLVGEMTSTKPKTFNVTSKSMGALHARQWYHAAMVFDRDSLILYVNGNAVDAIPMTGPLVGSLPSGGTDSVSVLFGNNWGRTTPFYGYLDEIRLSSVGRQPWEFNVNLARAELSATQLQFERVLVGQRRTLKLWVRNRGIDELTINDVTSSLPSVFQIDTVHFTIPSGGSQLVHVTFSPLASGRTTGQLTLHTNDPFWPVLTDTLVGDGLSERLFDAYDSDSFTLALFHFDEKKDTVLYDSSSNQLRGGFGVGDNVARTDSGRFGRALRFSGGSALVPYSPFLNLTSSEFTIEFWFSMLKTPGANAVLFKQGNGDTSIVEFSLKTTFGDTLTAKFWISKDNFLALKTGGMNKFNLNQWYHAAATFDGDSLRLYLNDKVAAKAAFAGILRQARTPLIRLGNDLQKGAPFQGVLDEMRISRIARAGWEFPVVPPAISVSPTELNFASVLVDSSRVMRFWVLNRGDQDLVVSSISGATGVFSIPDSLKSFTLPRLLVKAVPVTYRPTTKNVTNTGTLLVISNDSKSPSVRIQLEGSGTEAKGDTEYVADSHTLALYHLNSTTGDSAIDSSDRGHFGILKDDAQWVSNGFFKGGIYLDGNGDRIDIPPSPNLVFDYTKQSFSIECYFRTDTLSQTLLSLGISDSTHMPNYALAIDKEGRLTVPHFGTGGPLVNDASWHHAAFAYNYLLRSGRLYLDGKPVWSKPFQPYAGGDSNHSLILGAAQTDSAKYSGTFHGYLDEVRISDIVRESWEFQVADFGIEVQSVKPDPPEFGKPLTVTVYVPPALQATNVVFHYRQGGQNAYRTIEIEKQPSSQYKFVLPAEAISLQGFEYYIEVINPNETFTYPGLDPVNNPSTRSIQYAAVDAPITFQPRQFQMFSIPLQLDDASVKQVLEDDFGTYDPYQWRLFWWHREKNRYIVYMDSIHVNDIPVFGGPEYFNLGPSRAYWLVTSTEKKFDVGKGRTVPLDSIFTVSVDSGWNMIGNPFNFPVRWEDCSLSSDSVSTPYYFDPSTHVTSPDWTVLEPWKGYWIFNAGRIGARLFVLPKTRGLQKSVRSATGLVQSLSKGEWLIQLSAESKNRRDPVNYAGVKKNASATWDVWDRPDPPPVDAGLTLGFDHGDWKQCAGTYSADIRNADAPGHVWRFFVESHVKEENITLIWTFHQTLPEGWETYLFDLTEGTSVQLKEAQNKRFLSAKTVPSVRSFKLVSGSKEFIQAESEGIPLEPVVFHLFQNYPNPFNPETTIHYSIPKNGDVELTVFNALGQRVRQLLKASEKTGEHDIRWNGHDDSGRLVPSGVYIYRLRTTESTASRKMLLLK